MEDLLQPYAAAPDDIRWAADQVIARAIDVENLNSGVDGVHARAEGAVEGLLSGPLANAPVGVALRAYAVMQRSLFAGAAVKFFARYIDAYNGEVATLLQEWDDAVASNFGVQLDDGSALDGEAYEDAVTTARRDKECSLQLRQQAAENELQSTADVVTWMLAEGITDESLVVLWDTAALPAGAVVAFPGSDYMSQVNPVARWMHMVYTGVVPADELFSAASPDETPERAREFLSHNPHLIVEFALLLGLEGIALPERLYLEGLGRLDSDQVNIAHNEFVWGRSGQTVLDHIAEGVGRLDEINARIAAGEALTAGEMAYWQGWFHTIEPEVLVELPSMVERSVDDLIAANPDLILGVPQADEEEYIRRLRGRYLSPIADAVMHMSNPAVVHGPGSTTVIHLDDMPQVIQHLATAEIGVVSDDGRTLTQREGPVWGTTIDGLDEFTAFSDLMATSTVLGGERFTAELGEQAIRAQRQLDEIAGDLGSADGVRDALMDRFIDSFEVEPRAGTRWITENLWGEQWGPSPDDVSGTFDDLNELFDQGNGATSTLLSVVARYDRASSALLLGDELGSLLGADWRDDTGAVAVITAGTDRDPAGGDGTHRQADAASAVFLEVGSNPPARMSEGVAEATVDAGIEWIDTFAQGPAIPAREDPGVSLPHDARQGFLTFVAGTGTTDIDDPGTRFGYAVQVNSVDWIADALRAGDASQVDDALARAATLDGAFVRAIYEQRMEEHLAHPPAAHAASAAKQLQVAMLGDVASGDSAADVAIRAAWLDTEGSPAIAPELVSASVPSAVPGADRLARVGGSEPIVPEAHLGTYERTFIEHTHAAAGSRDYLLLVAARAADSTQAGHDQSAIPPYGEVRDQVLRDGGDALDGEVAAAVQRISGDDLAVEQYDEAWERATHTVYEEMFDDLQDR